jgi:antitoxin Phd
MPLGPADLELTILAKIANMASGMETKMPNSRTSISATVAKNEFGRVLEQVIKGATVVITRHSAPKAVLISVDEFNALSRSHRVELDTLSGEFDLLLAGMQKPAARAGMKAAFEASPKRLGQAAVAARKRAR